jgi:hypothetical protein
MAGRGNGALSTTPETPVAMITLRNVAFRHGGCFTVVADTNDLSESKSDNVVRAGGGVHPSTTPHLASTRGEPPLHLAYLRCATTSVSLPDFENNDEGKVLFRLVLHWTIDQAMLSQQQGVEGTTPSQDKIAEIEGLGHTVYRRYSGKDRRRRE